MQTLAQTAHFDIQYDETLIGPDGNPNAISRAQRILGVCEAEFGLLANWYKITGGFGPITSSGSATNRSATPPSQAAEQTTMGTKEAIL